MEIQAKAAVAKIDHDLHKMSLDNVYQDKKLVVI